MKKLLALVVVLGIASVASADMWLEMTPIVDGNVTWSVLGMQLIGTGTALGNFDGSIGPITGAPANTNVGAGKGFTIAAGVAAVGPDGFGGFQCASKSLGTKVQTLGDWFIIDILGQVGDSYVVQTWNARNDYAQATGEATVKVVPEPITMTLLGLGGLLGLRRRMA